MYVSISTSRDSRLQSRGKTDTGRAGYNNSHSLSSVWQDQHGKANINGRHFLLSVTRSTLGSGNEIAVHMSCWAEEPTVPRRWQLAERKMVPSKHVGALRLKTTGGKGTR